MFTATRPYSFRSKNSYLSFLLIRIRAWQETETETLFIERTHCLNIAFEISWNRRRSSKDPPRKASFYKQNFLRAETWFSGLIFAEKIGPSTFHRFIFCHSSVKIGINKRKKGRFMIESVRYWVPKLGALNCRANMKINAC